MDDRSGADPRIGLSGVESPMMLLNAVLSLLGGILGIGRAECRHFVYATVVAYPFPGKKSCRLENHQPVINIVNGDGMAGRQNTVQIIYPDCIYRPSPQESNEKGTLS